MTTGSFEAHHSTPDLADFRDRYRTVRTVRDDSTEQDTPEPDSHVMLGYN